MPEETIDQNEIQPSSTPLKRYSLRCPYCDNEDDVHINLATPEEPICFSCDETGGKAIELDSLEELLANWREYISDLKALEAIEVEEKAIWEAERKAKEKAEAEKEETDE